MKCREQAANTFSKYYIKLNSSVAQIVYNILIQQY